MMSFESFTSLIIFFIRSSNSPRYFVPATSEVKSRERMRFFKRPDGTEPFATACASPSTIAVFPIPGSPTRTGLFFVRRERICIRRWISFSRPTTGSAFPSRKRRVISRLYSDRKDFFSGASRELCGLFPAPANRLSKRPTPFPAPKIFWSSTFASASARFTK